jgi:alkaline phosphatase D
VIGVRAVVAAVVAILLLPGGASPTTAGLLVTVGEVTPTSAVVWARGAAPGNVTLEYGPVGRARSRARIEIRAAADLTGKRRIEGLSPATRYGYRLAAHGESVDGEFVTAPAPDADAAVTFAWSGDLGGQGVCRHPEAGYPIFDVMARFRPDFFLFLGDTIYADSRCDRPGDVGGGDFLATTLEGFRSKHRYNRADPAVQRFARGASVYAIWDDHEVRNDFAGPTEPLMAAGRQAFLDYWPVVPPREEPGRLYRRVRWGAHLELFILDTRQYRSPNASPDGPGKTMLGAAQRRWLIDAVTTSTARWKVVVSSVPMSVSKGAVRDSWSNATIFGVPEEGVGFVAERDAILAAFRAARVTNLVVLSGDVHYVEAARLMPFPGWTFHELIAGPLAARPGRPIPLDDGLNPRSLFSRGGTNNFSLVTVDATGLTVRFVAGDGSALFTHTLSAR